jgi:uracil phosphoribosyltransferase
LRAFDFAFSYEEPGVSSVVVSLHPIVQHHIAVLRDVRTPPAEFRRVVRMLAVLLAQEATADLPTNNRNVVTPLGTARGRALKDVIGIVPILRAGLGMADGVIELLPEAEVWHIGLYRDESTLRPKEYYNKFPVSPRVTLALLVDPMLATGGSAVRACEILKAAGVPRMKLLTLIAAPEGIANLERAMPDVTIHVGAVDERLNAEGFIYPGLGDAGDRQFGTGAEAAGV